MATCASCGEWMSALVYACPACGAKPKSPPPRGLVISDTLPKLGLDMVKKSGRPRAPAKPSRPAPPSGAPAPPSEPAPAAQRPAPAPAPAPETEPFPKAPGPAAGEEPQPLPDVEPPKPAVRRPAAGARPAPRRPVPTRKEPPTAPPKDDLDDLIDPDETSDEL